jgi:hypothetical protein
MLTLQNAQHALNVHASANVNAVTLNAQAITNLLANKNTFASIVYVTQVATSAKHKHVNIQKVTKANVQLFSTQFNYAQAVQKSASKISANNANNVQQFTAQANYFTHTSNCYSIVQHNSNSNLYLYASFNNASSVYFINNVVATKQQVAQYLTASASAKLLQDHNTVVHNATNNVLHTVNVRTIALANIVSIVANKQQISV